MLRGCSAGSNRIILNVLALRSTSARVVIISQTNSPPPCSRQRVRKGALVIPAMGARTMGGQTSSDPSFNDSTRLFLPHRARWDESFPHGRPWSGGGDPRGG